MRRFSSRTAAVRNPHLLTIFVQPLPISVLPLSPSYTHLLIALARCTIRSVKTFGGRSLFEQLPDRVVLFMTHDGVNWVEGVGDGGIEDLRDRLFWAGKTVCLDERQENLFARFTRRRRFERG